MRDVLTVTATQQILAWLAAWALLALAAGLLLGATIRYADRHDTRP